VGAQSGQTRKKAGRQRLAVAVFAVLLVLLVAGFAVAQGIGNPSVPSGDVAVVENVPDDIGTVSEKEFDLALVQQAAQGGLKKPPKPGEKKFDELKSAALGELLDTIWIQGEAEELGISVTDKQIATELEQIKKQNFKTDAAYAEFLKTSKFTQEDVDKRVRLQLLSTQIQETITSKAPPASNSEIADYYDAAKATQFTTAPSRDIRLVVNKDKAKVEEAKAELEKDDSPQGWKVVAAKYSSDPSTKDKGGEQKGITEELLQGPIKAAIFEGATGELAGPVEFQGNFAVIQVEKLNPEKVKTLGEVRSQISTQLTQQEQQEFFTEFIAEYQGKWESRTFCADDFLIERCANYVGSGRPASAPPACYEANPKGGTPTECPAPVAQNTPAIPGSVSLLTPQGERLAQRPRPEGLEEASGEEGLTLPEGGEVPIPQGE